MQIYESASQQSVSNMWDILQSHVQMDALSTHYTLHRLAIMSICCGNFEERFKNLYTPDGRTGVSAAVDRRGVFFKGTYHPATIRRSTCSLLTPDMKCSDCMIYNDTLRAMLSRKKKGTDDVTMATSQTRFTTLHKQQLIQRGHSLSRAVSVLNVTLK